MPHRPGKEPPACSLRYLFDHFTRPARPFVGVVACCDDHNVNREDVMKGVVLWVAGVPLSVILLLYLFGFM